MKNWEAIDAKAGVMLAFAGALAAVELRAFRDRYLASEPTFARLHLTDPLVTTVERDMVILDRKAARVKGAMTLLATAACLVVVGLVVD